MDKAQRVAFLFVGKCLAGLYFIWDNEKSLNTVSKKLDDHERLRQPDPTAQVESHPPYMDSYRAYPPRKARLGLGILSIVSRLTPMRPKVMEKPFCHSKLSIRLQWQ